MKYLLLATFGSLLAFAAPAQQRASVQKITFRSATRGSQEQLMVTADSAHTETSGRLGSSSKSRPITEAQWQALINSLQGVSLSDMGRLESPTHLRERDAAMYSTISIHTADSTYTSSSFDNHQAPAALQPLMQQLEALLPAKEKKK